MKKLLFLTLCLLMLLSLTISCDHPDSPQTETDTSFATEEYKEVPTDADVEQTQQETTPVLETDQSPTETTPALEIPKPYSDELWRSTSIAGHPWLEPIKDRQEIAGEEFEIKYTFMTEDYNYSEENYDFEFTVSDPTVAEVLVYGYDNKVLYDGWPSAVRLKGLKPGMIWVEMKMIHKETGGVYCTYVGVEIVPATDITS